MKTYGLIGFPLSHSFSKKYFEEKFQKENISGCGYRLFPLKTIAELPALLENENTLSGFNVTIPYKQEVIAFLQELDETASAAGAVNTVYVTRNTEGKVTSLRGYNTDVSGFEKSLLPLLQPHHRPALILGTGGASRAVQYVLKKTGIEYLLVSRFVKPGLKNCITYNDLTAGIIRDHKLIINTTPCGMYPAVQDFPPIPYESIGTMHLSVDLVYNPEVTEFLRKSKERGSQVKNGLEMLYLQAEEAWLVWNRNY